MQRDTCINYKETLSVARRNAQRHTSSKLNFKMKRCTTGRATPHIKQSEIKMNRRATKRATQLITKDEFELNCRAMKRATRLKNKGKIKYELSGGEARDAVHRLN
jgi:putative cell wall-binding protein